MNGRVQTALTESKRDFLTTVVPRILPILGGGEIVPVEEVSAAGFVKDLDVLAGIDAWHLIRGECVMRGIASRVQWVDSDPYRREYRTFTVRTRTALGNATEFDKRMTAITEAERGWLYPHLTCQAYLQSKGGPLLSVAVAKTSDVIYCVSRGVGGSDKELPAPGGNWFRAVSWKYMIAAGLLRFVLPGPDETPELLL